MSEKVASPLAVLRAGILGGDWGEVERGYALLTGEDLKSGRRESDDHDLTELLARGRDLFDELLSRFGRPQENAPEDGGEGVGEKNGVVEVTPPPVSPKKRGKKKGKVVTASPIRPADAVISPDALDLIAESMSQTAPQKMYRPPYREVPAKCCRCQREEMVPPLLAPKRIEGEETNYVCDRCTGK
jgi:hypothetical protein